MATKEATMATKEAAKTTTYTIGGVTVEFPCKAYSTQVSMMSMIIKGIERQQNCLLESPTGSGKSLALLCSCLAWQRSELKKQLDEDTVAENDQEENALCKCSCNDTSPSLKSSTVTSTLEGVHASQTPSSNKKPPEVEATPEHPCNNNGTCQTLSPGENCCTPEPTPSKSKRGLTSEDQDADDFQPSKKKRKRVSSVKKNKKKEVSDCEEEVVEVDSTKKTPCQCQCHAAKDVYKRRRVPKIFFGTRTHKQIAQLIKELGKTAYNDVQMSILGSREHTCVHPTVSAGPYKNEGCKELLDGRKGGSCQYFNGVHKMKHQWQLRSHGLSGVWDIEDLVTVGKKIKACPYYAVRSLKDDADIIFCPYNYLVDPIIRSTMEINLKGQIVVLDEAHNIEDSAREAASCSVTVNQLEDTVNELDTHIENKWRKRPCKILHAVMNALLSWFKGHLSTFGNRRGLLDRALNVWSGAEMVALLKEFGICEATLPSFLKNLALILEDAEPQKKELEEGVSLSSSSGMTLKNLFVIFGFLLKNGNKFMKDYKVVVMRTLTQVNKLPRHKSTDDRWITKHKKTPDQSWTMTLNFWCLNPAVAFTDFGELTRTIVLTSGTLSPMASFQSELGVVFPIQLEYSHVVNMSQVWIASIAEGPSGETLNSCYKNAETFKFQDEIGRLLHEVCQKIPYGVLCFFPSYGMMDKLSKRWKNTGQWEKLTQVKAVMSETRGADKNNFEKNLRDYYEVIENLEQGNSPQEEGITGALFLAVCRGKVSEGMDFANNNARAVMTIGIPYPSIRDTQVELKQQYNDTYSTTRGLLTGSEWYEIQAYRAINQALGRCIRHKKDWGALILADYRFSKNPKKYTSGLSKWVRNNLHHHASSETALSSLEEFAKERIKKSRARDPSTPNCGTPSPGPRKRVRSKAKVCQSDASVTRPRNKPVPLLPKQDPSQKKTSVPPYTPGPNKDIVINMNPQQGQLARVVASAQGQQGGLANATPMKFFMSTPNAPKAAPLTLVSGSSSVPVKNSAPGFGQATQSPILNTNQQVMPGRFYTLGPKNSLIPVIPRRSQENPAQLISPSSNKINGDHNNPGITPTQPLSKKYLMVAPNTSNVAPAVSASGPAPSIGVTSPVNTVVGPKILGTYIPKEVKKHVPVNKILAILSKTPGECWLPKFPPLGIKDGQCKSVPFSSLGEKLDFDSTSPESNKGQVGTKGVRDKAFQVIGPTEKSPTKDYGKDAQGGRGSDSLTTPQSEDTNLTRQIIQAEHDYTPPLFDSDIVTTTSTTTQSDNSGDSKQEGSGKGGKADGMMSANLLRQLRKKGGVNFPDETIPKRYKRLAFEKSLCRIGLFCKTCGKRVLLHMKGVSLIPHTAVADKFSDLVNLPKPRFSKSKKSRKMCWCKKGRAGPEGALQDARGLRNGFINISTSFYLKNVSVLSNRPSKGFSRNAYWSEKDQCCYQPIGCAVCQMKHDVKTPVIGYKVVAVGPDLDSTLADQVWLFPDQVGHCRGLCQHQRSEGGTSSQVEKVTIPSYSDDESALFSWREGAGQMK